MGLESFVTRGYILLLVSAVTFIFLSFALYRTFTSTYSRSLLDVLILFLSILQVFLTLLHFILLESIYLIIMARVMKLVQCICICWIFLIGIYGHRRSIKIVSFYVVSYVMVYCTILVYRQPSSDTYCTDIFWMGLSISWFIVTLVVGFLGIVILMKHKKSDQRIMLMSDAVNQPMDTFGMHPHADRIGVPLSLGDVPTTMTEYEDNNAIFSILSSPVSDREDSSLELMNLKKDFDVSFGDTGSQETLVSKDGLESADGIIGKSRAQWMDEIETVEAHIPDDESSVGRPEKQKRLMLLIFIEAICALLTLTWDFIMYLDKETITSCSLFLSSTPNMEVVLYLVSRIVNLIAPNWAVYYVFYWVDRRIYTPLRVHWDIDLAGAERYPDTW